MAGPMNYEHQTQLGCGGNRRSCRQRLGQRARQRLEAQQPLVKAAHEDVGRNDPCWCGSGKKFKRCHGA